MTLDEAIKLKPKDTVWIFDEQHMELQECFVIKVFLATNNYPVPISNLNSIVYVSIDRYNDKINSFTMLKKLHQVFKTKEELLKQITN